MQRLNSILVKVLEINESDITDDLSPEKVGTWDSFNGLMLVSELESTFDVKFTMQEIISVESVRNIKDILKSHGVDLN